MSIPVDLDDLLSAFEWMSAGEAATVDAEAYISRIDGHIHWCGEGVDDEPPEDIEDEAVYVAVPHKSELHLGRSLALRFTEEHLPQSRGDVVGYFHKQGAYARFKSLLERAGLLDAWHQYEQTAKEEALSQWCSENGFTVSRRAAGE